MSRDTLVRATALGGRVRAFAIDSTGVTAELIRRHDPAPSVTAALGRLTTGTLLFAAMLKDADHLVTIRIQGDGPAGVLMASANGDGSVRGLAANPRPEIDQVRSGKLFVSGAVGTTGSVTVTKDLGLGQPYVGMVELVSGEIGEDLAHYLARSEQVPSALGIGVYLQTDVVTSGGYLVQLLPGVSDSDAAHIESVISRLPHPTEMLREGDTPRDILERIFGDDLNILDERSVRFQCHCTTERVENAVRMQGPDALAEMIAEGAERGGAEVICEFCRERYLIPTERLQEMKATSRG